MVIDTSALIAAILKEPDAQDLLDAILRDESRQMSAATLTEARIVAFGKLSHGGVADLDELLSVLEIKIVPHDEALAKEASLAFQKYGKGTGHKAQLNFGDCFAYALAKATGEALLFKGTDFQETDITAVTV
jgi:ribonuclease VapC